jgi:hypothetical protein
MQRAILVVIEELTDKLNDPDIGPYRTIDQC